MSKNARQLFIVPRLALLASSALGASIAGCGGGSNSGGGTGGATTSVKPEAGPDLAQVVTTGGAVGMDAMAGTGAGGISSTGGISGTGGTAAGGGTAIGDASTVETYRPDSSQSVDAPIDVITLPTDAPLVDGPVGPAQCRTPRGAFGFGGPTITNAVPDQEGSLYVGAVITNNVAVDFRGKQVVSNGSTDMLVAKLDPKTGNAIWVRTAGDAKDQATTDVAATSAGIGVAGTFTGTLDIANDPSSPVQPMSNPTTKNYQFLAGLKSGDGTPSWAKPLNLGDGSISHIAGRYDKDYFVVCGSATNNASALGATGTPGGARDVLVAAIKASDGTVLWAKIFGGPSNQQCNAAALDDSGNAVFAGVNAGGTLDFGSGALPITSNAWVAKFNASTGALLAAQPFGTAVSSTGGVDAGVGATLITPNAVATNAQGDIAVAGMLRGAASFGSALSATGLSDALVVKLSGTSLSPIWARRWGAGDGTSSANSAGAVFDSVGNTVIVGAFQNSIDVGGVTQVGGIDGGLAGVLNAQAPTANTAFVVTLNGSTGQALCANAYGGSATGSGLATTVFIDRWATGGTKDDVVISGSYKLVIDFLVPGTVLSASAWDTYVLEM